MSRKSANSEYLPFKRVGTSKCLWRVTHNHCRKHTPKYNRRDMLHAAMSLWSLASKRQNGTCSLGSRVWQRPPTTENLLQAFHSLTPAGLANAQMASQAANFIDDKVLQASVRFSRCKKGFLDLGASAVERAPVQLIVNDCFFRLAWNCPEDLKLL